ncbi:hypothetical protein EIP86_008228 [Pleurotus ostreatoroseus]|nr:hypothetical protein EIP86_008228 [Pleurotus ostreatoroseus]
MTGYLAFPPSTSDNFVPTQRVPLSFIQQPQAEASRPSVQEQKATEEEKIKEEAARKRVEREEKRRERREREQQQIWLNELEWVRSGGILRDKHGRRDMARTEEMRKEIWLQEEEQRIQELWESYENRWRKFMSAGPNASLSWEDIPWPVYGSPSSPADLDADAIAQFIFATLLVRGSTGSKKEKIRSFFLRWHPDKFPAALLSQTSEEEREKILDGVSSVFMSLKLIQDVEKRTS